MNKPISTIKTRTRIHQRTGAILKAEASKASTWIKAFLLVAVNYTDTIMGALHEHLPELQAYLPENIFKAMGIAVVTASIVRSVVRTGKASQ